MLFRAKNSQGREYLQIVENRREDGRVRQRVITTLGWLGQLKESGRLDALLQSAARLAESVLVVSAHTKGELTEVCARRIGAVKIFERLWQESGCQSVIEELLAARGFAFAVERAIFLTVLHRLLAPDSDRAAERWREDYAIADVDGLELHHLYRAMAWLGEPLSDQGGATPFSPRCTKDRIEEGLFARSRDLFSELERVFFDTTSICFEGEGGETLGQRGYSKDHRPDLKQLLVGAVLDGHGRPIACELWPGNDRTTPVRFSCKPSCTASRLHPNRSSARLAFPAQYFTAISAWNARRSTSDIFEAASLMSSIWSASGKVSVPEVLNSFIWFSPRLNIVCKLSHTVV